MCDDRPNNIKSRKKGNPGTKMGHTVRIEGNNNNAREDPGVHGPVGHEPYCLADLDFPFPTPSTTWLGHTLEVNSYSPFLSLYLRVGY